MIMKRLTTLSLIAAAAAAMIAIPLDAQPRGGSNVRGGAGAGARSSQSAPERNRPDAPQNRQDRQRQQKQQKPQNPKQQKKQQAPPRQPGAPGQVQPPRPGRDARRTPPPPPQAGRRPAPDAHRIPPRRREPMPFGHAVRFWDSGRHYFGYRVSHLPHGYVRRVYRGITYYVLDGIYYRRHNGHYYVCRPPFGISFDPVAERMAYNACRFAYYYDVYNSYRTIDENARVIASQNEAIAANNATLARQNADIAINAERAARSYREADRLGLVQSYADAGTEYFYEDGVFFTKGADGRYETLIPPAGALVQELPDDYETIELGGREYCKVDDTVYRMTVVDGTPYFEVLGQMSGELAAQYDPYNAE